MPVFLYMLYNVKEITVKGIYLYALLLTKCLYKKGQYSFTPISLEKMVKETGLNKSTVEKYIGQLEKHGLIEVERGQFIEDEYGDIKKPGGSIIKKEINRYKVYTDLSMCPDFNAN